MCIRDRCIGTSTVVGAPNFKKRNIENESNETFLFYSSAVRKTEGGGEWRQNLLLPDEMCIRDSA